RAILKVENLKKSALKRMDTPGKTKLATSTMPFRESSFYFYDPVQVERGKQVFKRIWGDRDLQDNWRRAPVRVRKKERKIEKSSTARSKQARIRQIEANPQYTVQYYLENLP